MRLLTALAVGLGLVLVPSASAWAGEPTISGCQGHATSLDGAGEVLAEADGAPPHELVDAAGEPTFTSDNPFRVSPDGSVEWSGDSTSLILDGTWSVKVWGYTVDDGAAANGERVTHKDGTYTLDGVLPLDARGLVKVDVALEGDGGVCRGSGFVEFEGSPTFTPPWLAGAALVLGGAGLLVVAQPKQRWRRS